MASDDGNVMPKKILIFAAGQLDRIGGLQRSYQILTGHLIEKGWDVTLYGFGESLSKKPKPSDLGYPLLNKVKVRIIEYGISKKNYKFLLAKVKDDAPDIILVINSSHKGAFYCGIAEKLGIPYVFSIRGSSEYCLRYLWPCKKVFDLPFKTANGAHVLMPSYVNLLPSEVKSKVSVIPSPIEPADKFSDPGKPDENGRYKILYAGRLTHEKQVHYLLQAFKLLVDDFLDWDLVIAGYGPLESDLKKQATDLCIDERIKWIQAKNTKEMYDIYPQMNIKVLPSEYEGCPLSLREAMAHGLPVVAYSTCSGSNEIIDNEVDGLLADASKPVTGLMDCLRRLMKSSSIRNAIGENAIKKAEKYSPLNINIKWEKLLISSMQNRASKPYKDSKEIVELAESCNITNKFEFYMDCSLYAQHKNNYLLCYKRELFNPRYYLEKNVEVKISGVDPLMHYLSEGWKNEYNPSPEFDTKKYIDVYLNNKSKNICPLVHYYQEGFKKGFYPFRADHEYYLKWPGRKPKKRYTIYNDISNIIEKRNNCPERREDNISYKILNILSNVSGKVTKKKIHNSYKLMFLCGWPFGSRGTPGTYKIVEQAMKDHDVSVLTPDFLNPVIDVNKFPCILCSKQNGFMLDIKSIMREIEKFCPDIVHVINHPNWPGTVKKIKKKYPDVKLILDIKTPLLVQGNRRLKIQDQGKEACSFLDLIFTPTPASLGTWIPDMDVSYVCYPLGVDVNLYPTEIKHKTTPPKKFIYIGSINNIRKIDNLIQSFASFLHKFDNFQTLDIFGSGTELDERNLKNAIEENAISDRVVYHGLLPQHEILQNLPNYDVGLAWVPTETFNESPSLKIIEYMAAGLTVIATNTKAHVQMQEEGFEFILSEANSEDFANSMLELKNCDTTKIHESLNKNKQKVSMFSYSRIFNDIVSSAYDCLVYNDIDCCNK